MEAIIILSLFPVIAVLSLRYGYDSRPGLSSKEEQLASFGVSWMFLPVAQAEARRRELLSESSSERLACQVAKPRRSLRDPSWGVQAEANRMRPAAEIR